MATINPTEIDAVVSADWGESLFVDGQSVAGCTFARRRPEFNDEFGAVKKSVVGVATLPAGCSAVPAVDGILRREADDSLWVIRDVNPLASGRIALDLRAQAVHRKGGA